MDIYNCPTVAVRNCTFEHNGPVSVTKPQPYRGHAGGLSFGYYPETLPGPHAIVSHCVFRNNSSDPLTNLQSTTQLFQYFLYTGRGGGCAFIINHVYSLNATLEDCHFQDNFARSYGGGLYIGLNGHSNHTVIVNRVKMVRNWTPLAAGGLEVGHGEDAVLESVFVYNSEFIENYSGRGGGVYVFAPGNSNRNYHNDDLYIQVAVKRPDIYHCIGRLHSDGQLSNFVHFENCTFTRNVAEGFGAAIGLLSPVLAFNRFNSERVKPFEIENW